MPFNISCFGPVYPRFIFTAKTTKWAAPGPHPSYGDMIKEAITTLNGKKGSSRQVILKFIASKYKLGDNLTMVNANLRQALKRGVATGVLKQTTGSGASGSFKLGESKGATSKTNTTKPKLAKPSTKKTASSPKKTSAKAVKPKKAASPKNKATTKPKVATKAASSKKMKSPKTKGSAVKKSTTK